MDHFHLKHGQLYCEDVALSEIAKHYGTPCYVYSCATFAHHFNVFQQAFGQYPHLICYALKANSNIAVIDLLAKLGAGFDIVSLGELERVIHAGGSPNKVVFSGVGKQDHELLAALKAGILCFNIESEDELRRLAQIAEHQNLQANIAIRVNPDVDAKSHPFISTGLKENKFGLPLETAKDLYLFAKSLAHINITGLASHIGSQILTLNPYIEMAQKLNDFMDELKANGIVLEHVDLGGGLGVPYTNEQPPSPKQWVEAMLPIIQKENLRIIIEPGRALAANAGVLITKIISIKNTPHKRFAIVDAAMNDLLRPALYDAYQDIVPVSLAPDPQPELEYDIVGPICESGDFIGKSRKMHIAAHDLLAIRGVGAYGFVMSSNYNTRPRAPEVLVNGNKHACVRVRETIKDLLSLEKLLPNEFWQEKRSSTN